MSFCGKAAPNGDAAQGGGCRVYGLRGAKGKGSVVKWVGKYDAKGASEADAKKTIDGIYDSGLKALTTG